MDDLKSELKELKEFIADLKADRAATKEKERRESWTKYVSLTIVAFAVISSISSQWSGKYSSMTQMSQAQASDQWNYYEALSIKQNMYTALGQLLARQPGDPDTVKATKDFAAKIADYNTNKVTSKADAERLEKKRDTASRIGAKLGLANSFFAVSIATASLCMLTKKKPLWFCSMAFAAAGIAQMVLAKMITIP